ncbi:MAG: hypothetical protein ACAI43_15070, partial [Phycisphaerae bacterium]
LALIGPGGTTGVTKDGADGPGFRTVDNGKVWGPYLPIEKFKASAGDGKLLDRYDMEIYYFPQWRASMPGTPLFGTAGNNPLKNGTVGVPSNAVYDWAAADTDGYAADYLRKALGDDDLNDLISPPETLKETPQFILLSVGQRKKFTAADTGGKEKIKTNFEKCDEVSTVPGAP